MPISATGNKRQRGFTLVETMVVLAIVGLMAAVVVVNLPAPGEDLSREGERFAARLLAARDQAILDNRDTAAVVDARGYRFEQRRGENWQVMQDRPLAPARWHDGTRAGFGAADSARIGFDSVGMSEPKVLTLTRAKHGLTVRIDASGEVSIDAVR